MTCTTLRLTYRMKIREINYFVPSDGSKSSVGKSGGGMGVAGWDCCCDLEADLDIVKYEVRMRETLNINKATLHDNDFQSLESKTSFDAPL